MLSRCIRRCYDFSVSVFEMSPSEELEEQPFVWKCLPEDVLSFTVRQGHA